MLAVSFGEVAEIVVGVTLSGAGLVALFAKFRDKGPIRWVVAQLVIEPASEVLDRRIDGRVERAVASALEQPMHDLTEQVERLGLVVHSIHYEMHPNSGASMRDVLDRLEGTTILTQGQVDTVQEDVAAIRDRTARLEGSVEVLKGHHY